MTAGPCNAHRACVVAMVGMAWLASAAWARRTLVVGPGGFAQISAAIRAASPGDTILITASARYDPFLLDRGVTIRAAPGVRPIVGNGLSGGSRSDTVVAVPAGQHAEVVGVLFAREAPLWSPRFNGRVEVRAGIAVFRDCWFEGQTDGCGTGWPALEVAGARVALQLCRLKGFDSGGVALLARDATVSAFDSTFEGGIGCWDASAFGAHAVELIRSELHASRVVIDGGDVPAINNAYDAGHGLVLDSGSRAWLAHAIVQGGDGSAAPGRCGDGIHSLSPAPVEAVRLTVRGGTGAIPGAAVRGALVIEPNLLVVTATPTAPILGSVWTIDVGGAPQTLVAALASFDLAPQHIVALQQPFWLQTTPPPALAVLVQTDATGIASIALAMPGNPALRGQRLWVQLVGFGSRPGLEASPLLGGQVW